MKRLLYSALIWTSIWTLGGCVNARAPDIYIDRGPRPADVDSSRVPPTRSHEEAREELAKAYDQIRYLEHENRRLVDKLKDAREERDEYKHKYKGLKDRYDD